MSNPPSEIYTVPWYPNEYPSEHDAVLVKLTKTDEMGIWVTLLEYGSKEGMIPLGQYTTRRTRRIPKNVKVGKIDVALVSLVDAEKGNMDDLPYKNQYHLRYCLMQVRNKGGKNNKVVARSVDDFLYRSIRKGFYVGAGDEMLYYPMPSKEQLENEHYLWWRSAQSAFGE